MPVTLRRSGLLPGGCCRSLPDTSRERYRHRKEDHKDVLPVVVLHRGGGPACARKRNNSFGANVLFRSLLLWSRTRNRTHLFCIAELHIINQKVFLVLCFNAALSAWHLDIGPTS